MTVPFWNWLFAQDPGGVSGQRFAAQQEDRGDGCSRRNRRLRAAGPLEAAEPPEARGLGRDAVRLLVSDIADDTIDHARFRDLPHWLRQAICSSSTPAER